LKKKKRRDGYEGRIKGCLEVIRETKEEENYTKDNTADGNFSKIYIPKTSNLVRDKLDNLFNKERLMTILSILINL
jgi:hypothetical protein